MSNAELLEELAQFSSDPLGFVYFAFPWGEEGELEDATGPEEWQATILSQLGKGVLGISEAMNKIQLARTSGHGIGKSACVSWIILWALSTFEDTKGVVTANTETQLKTKTWVELAKWYRNFIAHDCFKMTATCLYSSDPAHEKTWRLDLVPWSERNTEAFAGLHNQDKRLLIIYDEASAIPDMIWEVTEGALTDKPPTQIIWCAFGNPTRNKGRFRECFPGGKFAHRWQSATIDSREVTLTDKAQFERWIEDYGEDHDFVRVRVRGVFPRVDAESFIPLELAREAANREITPPKGLAVVIGVDVGRFGDDPSVIYARKGRDARSIPPEIYFNLDTMSLATKVMQAYQRHHASFCYVDGGGVGGGVVDRLNSLRIPVIEVQFGARMDGTNDEPGVKYANKRAEIWGAIKRFLITGTIPDAINGLELGLVDELTAPTFGLNTREEIQLESKKEMRKRGVGSPNVADALACTFAYPDYIPDARGEEPELKPYIAEDYDPFTKERIYA